MDITGIILVAIVAVTVALYKGSQSFREFVDIVDEMEYKEEEEEGGEKVC